MGFKRMSDTVNNQKMAHMFWPKLARKELARKLNYENLPPEEKKDARNALWKINQIYHEGARNLLRVKRNIETDMLPSETIKAPRTGPPRGTSRTNKLRLSRRLRKTAYKHVKTHGQQGPQGKKTIQQYLREMQGITLPDTNMTQDTSIQRAANKADKLRNKRRREIDPSEDVVVAITIPNRKRKNPKSKQGNKKKRRILLTPESTKGGETPLEENHTPKGIQEYLVRLNGYRDLTP
jgi:hypothetical protein